MFWQLSLLQGEMCNDAIFGGVAMIAWWLVTSEEGADTIARSFVSWFDLATTLIVGVCGGDHVVTC